MPDAVLPGWLPGTDAPPDAAAFARDLWRGLVGTGQAHVTRSLGRLLPHDDPAVEELEAEWIRLMSGISGRDLVASITTGFLAATRDRRRRAQASDAFFACLDAADGPALAKIERLLADLVEDLSDIIDSAEGGTKP